MPKRDPESHPVNAPGPQPSFTKVSQFGEEIIKSPNIYNCIFRKVRVLNGTLWGNVHFCVWMAAFSGKPKKDAVSKLLVSYHPVI